MVEISGDFYFEAAPTSDRYQEWENDPYKDKLFQYCEGNDGACYAKVSRTKNKPYLISEGAFWQPDHLKVFGKSTSASGCELTWMDVLESY